MPWCEVTSVVKRLFLAQAANGTFNPNANDPDRGLHYDVESSQEILGLKFAVVEVIVRSMLGQNLELLSQGGG